MKCVLQAMMAGVMVVCFGLLTPAAAQTKAPAAKAAPVIVAVAQPAK